MGVHGLFKGDLYLYRYTHSIACNFDSICYVCLVYNRENYWEILIAVAETVGR
jgi:hypothetical protein